MMSLGSDARFATALSLYPTFLTDFSDYQNLLNEQNTLLDQLDAQLELAGISDVSITQDNISNYLNGWPVPEDWDSSRSLLKQATTSLWRPMIVPRTIRRISSSVWNSGPVPP
jgi:hypothetical protein